MTCCTNEARNICIKSAVINRVISDSIHHLSYTGPMSGLSLRGGATRFQRCFGPLLVFQESSLQKRISINNTIHITLSSSFKIVKMIFNYDLMQLFSYDRTVYPNYSNRVIKHKCWPADNKTYF